MNNQVTPNFSGRICSHGECYNHDTEWENIGPERLELAPGLFGKKTHWFTRHCGKPMIRFKIMQSQQCKRCGRKRDESVYDYVVLCCSCCNCTIKQLDYSY